MNKIPHAEKLIERAQKGERLNAKDRRHAVAYLTATRPEITAVAMGDLFFVSEGMIRVDKRIIKQEKAKLLQKEDVALVIVDIADCFDRQVKDLEASKRKCKLGSATYLAHCKEIFNLRLKMVTALQELGYYPKNLGSMTIDKYEYRATVGADGAVTSRPVNLDVSEGEFEDIVPAQLAAPEAAVLEELDKRAEEFSKL